MNLLVVQSVDLFQVLALKFNELICTERVATTGAVITKYNRLSVINGFKFQSKTVPVRGVLDELQKKLVIIHYLKDITNFNIQGLFFVKLYSAVKLWIVSFLQCAFFNRQDSNYKTGSMQIKLLIISISAVFIRMAYL